MPHRSTSPGSIFEIRTPKGSRALGKIIRDNAVASGWNGALLVYIYRFEDLESADLPLRTEDLLLPPVMTSKGGWVAGLFKTVADRTTDEDEVLPIHCFESLVGYHFDDDDNRIESRYFDDQSRPLNERAEPCGVFGLTGHLLLCELIDETRASD